MTFTSVFKPGQVLFGKRRACQRKVAVADFAGVCSGDIYVLESQDVTVLLPELFPFICQTDALFDHVVGTSAGSLRPLPTGRAGGFRVCAAAVGGAEADRFRNRFSSAM